MDHSNTVVRAVIDPARRREIAADVLHDLPDWFGIPESTRAYIEESGELPFFAAHRAGEPIGFLTVRRTSRCAAEIHVMGVKRASHRGGTGRALVDAAIAFCRENGYRLLQVKTLDERHPDLGYAQTRRFYEAVGFLPLECFPTLWDEDNPCLVMVMPL
ncbi:MAG: GNAT family N-acetyltransferase [Clostridia bacterium]|nr:GNAT family N-acetyltransferase [Clostridia bacterium]